MKIEFKENPNDYYFSVFNQHINGAEDRAKELMALICPNYLKRVEEIEESHNGIMGIFNQEPEPATIAYASIVTAIVNIEQVDTEKTR